MSTARQRDGNLLRAVDGRVVWSHVARHGSRVPARQLLVHVTPAWLTFCTAAGWAFVAFDFTDFPFAVSSTLYAGMSYIVGVAHARTRMAARQVIFTIQ